MLHAHEPMYDVRKPPILLVQRREPFTCEICTRPGWGPPNTKVHPGKCRTKHSREIAKRNAAKGKARRLKEQEVLAASA